MLPFASAALADLDISVDKTTQEMTVSVDGATRYVFPVSTGRPGYNTPSGVFHPLWMSAMHHSKLYDDAPMPDSIFFDGDTPFTAIPTRHSARLRSRTAACASRDETPPRCFGW